MDPSLAMAPLLGQRRVPWVPWVPFVRLVRLVRLVQSARSVPLAMLVLLVLVSTGPSPAQAHEDATPHATLVQREGGLYSLSLNFAVVRALQAVSQPQATPAEFLLACSAMAPERFESIWAAAVTEWSTQTAMVLGGKPIAAVRWQWPSAVQAQALIREQLMHQLTGPVEAGRLPSGGEPNAAAAPSPALVHEHEPLGLAQARAEFGVKPDAAAEKAVALRIHPSLRPLSVTSYRPRQQWVGPGDTPIALEF